MWNRLIATKGDWTATVLRLTLGAVMLPHGAQKLLGWFGGFGLSGTMGFFTETMGMPAILAFAVIVVEFVSGLALIVGAGSRLAALGIGAIMIGSVATVHAPNGFFMNWMGSQAGEGFEYHLLAFAIALAVFIKGSGALSVDRQLERATA